jgi:DNA-binding response OmpR family regulator
MKPIRALVITHTGDRLAKIERSLKNAGHFKIRSARSAIHGLASSVEQPPDIALVDGALPDLDGLETCRIMRDRQRTAHVPIILIDDGSIAEEPDMALRAGADGYVEWTDLKELGARVQLALQRRATDPSQRSPRFHGRRLSVNFHDFLVTVDGRRVALSFQEFRLLRYLVEHREAVVTRQELMREAWPGKVPGTTRTIDVHINRLRSKLGRAGDQIETVVRVGYRFSEPAGVSPRR